MKKNFRKVISVICVLALLMSAVSVVLTTSSSAADLTCKDVTGVWDISSSSSVVVKDGENALFFSSHPATETTSPARVNFAPVNATGDGYFEVEAGKTYYVAFDYMVTGLKENCPKFTMDLYVGNTSKASGKVSLTSANTQNFYVPRMCRDKNVWLKNAAYFTIPADSQLITDTTKHLFVTFYTDDGVWYDFYVKNVRCEEVTDKQLIVYYDNGYQYAELGNAGDTITRVGQHAVEGEKFMGWYTEPDFVTDEYLVTEIPEVAGNISLFARYPSTVIDFNLIKGKIAGAKSSTDSNKYFNVQVAGIAQYRSNDPNGGVMLPAYDYDGYNNNGKFFQFDVQDNAKTYKLTFYYLNADSPEGKGVVHFIPATAYGSSGWRIGTTVGPSTTSSIVKGSSEINTFTLDIIGGDSASTTTRYKNVVKNKYSGQVKAGLAIRGYSIDFDKIVITETSEATAPYSPSRVTLKDGDTTIDSFMLAPGEVKALPVLKDTEDKIFAGWYDSDYKLGEKTIIYEQLKEDPDDAKKITGVNLVKDLAPKSCIVGDGKDYSLKAYWLPKELKVNFTGEFNTGKNYYVNHTVDGNNNYCSAGIYYDTEAKGMTFSKSPANGYRFILYDDNGNPVPALEGVDYEITIEYEITKADYKAQIAVLRDCKTLQNPCAISGSTGNGPANASEYFVNQTTAETTGRTTATINVTARNTMDYSKNGADLSKPYIKNVIAISPRLGDGIIYSVTVKALGYHPQTYGKNCDINIDYENGVATILPHEGYEFKFGTVKAYSLINDTLKNKVTLDVDDSCYKMGGYDLSKTGIDLTHIVVEAEAVAEGTIANNSKIVASSYQVKSNPDDLAGVRFLNRVTEKTMEGFDSAYFAVVPTALMGGKTMLEYLDDDDNLAAVGVAYDKNESIDIVYAMNGGVIDYQVYLRGLVPELEDVEMTVCFIGVKGTGESVVLGEKQDSYESIFNRVNA